MVNLALDARGNLMRLRAVPPQVEAAGAPAIPPVAPDWKPLFAAAGLDFARFSPSPPRWLPSEPFDARADWDGAYASSPDVPIHVAAASWRGRPVSFEVLGPWTLPERMQERATGLVIGNFAFLCFILAAWTAALFLARRNLLLGRGDRRSAIRIATFVFGGVMLIWVFSAHHVPTQGEGHMFLTFASTGVFLGAFVWLAYVAIEPIVRRRWPELLFSWSRLLAGRFRDPLVGRDVLAGILIGALLLLVLEAASAMPNWVDLAGMTPIPPSTATMWSVAGAASRLFYASSYTPLDALGFLTFLVLCQVLLRRRWLAVGLTWLLVVVVSLSGENYAVEIPMAAVWSALFLFAAVRFGVLAFTVSFFVYRLLAPAPLTLDLARWYAARGLFSVGLILALAIWAFRVSLGRKAAFAASRLDEA
jgi:hypothetical protein